jgi:hypothetical protein
MDEHGRRFDRMSPGPPVAMCVDHDDVVCRDLPPEQAARIQQEAARTVGQFDAEVIAEALGQPVVCRCVQGQGQVVAKLPHSVRLEIILV